MILATLALLCGIYRIIYFFIDLHTSKLSAFVLELSKLNNLEQLKLVGSSIDKSLLHKIGVMTSLNVLAVRYCGLNGTLPDRGTVFFFFHNDIALNNYNGRT